MTDNRKAKGTVDLNLILPVPIEVDVPVSASTYDAEDKLQNVELSAEQRREILLNWVQNASDEDLMNLVTDEYILDEDYEEIPKVTATVTPDPSLDLSAPDEVEIDATGYLEQASDETIKKLIDCDLGGDYPADAIYEHYRGKEDLKEIEDYLAQDPNPGGNNAQGYEVHVDRTEFERWLENRRAHLMDYLNNNEPLPGL